MALQKQVISLPLKMGVDTKESPTLVDNSRFLNLTNVVFDRGALGELHKRNGYGLIPSIDISGNPITGQTALAVFNDELDLLANGEFYAFGEKSQAFIPRGTIPAIGVTENAVEKGAVSISNPDSATLDGITLYAWVEPTGIYAKVIDEASGAVYAGRQALSGTLASPKVISTGAALLVLCSTSAGGLVSFSVNPAVPQTIGASHAIFIAGTLADNSIFDAAVVNSTLQLGGMSVGGSLFLSSVSLPGLTVTHTAVIVAVSDPQAITVVGVQNDVFITIAGGSSAFIHCWFYTTAGSSVSGPYTVASGLPTIPRLTAVASGTLTVTVYYENTNVGGINTLSGSTVVSGTGATSLGAFLYGLSLASQPLAGGYLLTQFPSTTQQTFFLQQIVPNGGGLVATVIGKYFALNAGPAPTNNRLPAFQSLGGTSYGLAVSDQIALESQDGKAVVIDGLSELVLDLSGTVRSAQLGQELLLASGSLLWGYDGSTLTEHGFNVYPEEPTLTFLTSPVISVVVDNLDPTGATPQSVSIYVSDNGANPGGPVGQLIEPGEYMVFNSLTEPISGSPTSATPYLFWFSLDGVGTAPSGSAFSAYTKVQIAILSSMTAFEVMNAIITGGVDLLGSFGNYTLASPLVPVPISQTNGLIGYRIVLTVADSTNAVSQPALNRYFSVGQIFQGSGSYAATIAITCCPGQLIMAGQYFTFYLYNSTGGGVHGPQYCYFTVNGIGTDPKPYGAGVSGVVVDITGSETADGVAALLEAAIAAAFPPGVNVGVNVTGPTTGGLGPVVVVTTVLVTGGAVVAVNNWASNPTTGGVEHGYIGENVNAVAELITVNYVAVYEWVDGQGQLHQSAPSVPVTAYIPAWMTAPGGADIVVPPNAVIKVGVQNLTLTLKPGVNIVIYRTPSDPPANPLEQVYYAVTNPPTLVPNDPGDVDPTTFIDFSSDASILSNQALYTTGGVLENDGPPACAFIINHQDRIWLASLEDPQLLWYSFEFVNGEGIAFSLSQTIRLNPGVGTVVGGPITALGSMDGNLAVFQHNQPWIIGGTGPDATGNNGEFQIPQLVTGNVGCRDPGSVVLIPDGLMFKSTQGWYLLSRQFQLAYIGVDVAAYNADVVASARVVTNSTQMRAVSAAGTSLIYDFFYHSWGTLAEHQGVAAVIDSSGVYTYIREDGLILYETPGVYSDDGTGFPMIVQSAWIKFAGINGFQRLWRFYLQGKFKSGQQYQAQIAYDEIATVVDTFVFTPTADTNSFRVYPSRQLCRALQFTFQDLATYATATTPALDSVDFEVGVRKGGWRGYGPDRSVG